LKGTKEKAAEGVSRGAYILSPSEKEIPDVLLLASGSEVSLAVSAQEKLRESGIDAAVISMPSWDRFEAQPEAYKEEVLPKRVKKRLAIEMGSSLGWHRYVGEEGRVLSIERFGASAPGETIVKEYGFTVENIVRIVKELLA